MNFENEVTVEVDTDLQSLIKIVESSGFKLKETYDLDDIYMINKDDRIKEKDYLSMLNKCVLFRNIIEENKETKMLTYKYKEYNDKKEIIKQGKIKCLIEDINNAKLLFEKLNFEELIKIHDHMLVYATDNDEIVIQSVNDKHLYIEIEDKGYYSGRVYNSIDEMKEVFTKYSIPIKGNNYFVKKAEIELYETYGNIENN